MKLRLQRRDNKMKALTRTDIEKLIKGMTHEGIASFRAQLKRAKNPNYLLRVLFYDYDLQVWIKPESI